MVVEYEESPELRFLADGRVWSGRHPDEFVTVYGQVQSGPRYRTCMTVPFDARIVRPEGEVDYARAVLHGPCDPDLVAEKDFFVVLYGADTSVAPAGTLICSIDPVPDDPAAWRAAEARSLAGRPFTRPPRAGTTRP